MKSSFRVRRLRCDYLDQPLGVDELVPRLSWQMESKRRGARQTAYHILVASSPALLARGVGDRWDSGRIETDRSNQIEYAGSPLASRAVCHWQVRVTDELGATALSAPALWTMGLLEQSDWAAQWITTAPAAIKRDAWAKASTLTQSGTPGWFRKEFSIEGPVRRATLYISARGLVEMHLGGARVGNDVFAPEWTDYHRRIHYRTYDVSDRVAAGANVLGAVLGDGWWSGYVGWQQTRARYGSLINSLTAQLEVELADGRVITIGSDPSWRAEVGPIQTADFMQGEVYDARRELTGWNRPGYDDSRWLPAEAVARPAAALVAQRSAPVGIEETRRPIGMTKLGPRTFIFNLGQNLTGWVRLRARAKAGTEVTIRHGELLKPDGTLYTENLRTAKSTDRYIFKGEGIEEWQPRFTFHGFQYVEVTGLTEAAVKDAVTGCVVGSICPPAGTFTCSHPGVNRLWLNGLWSQRCNFLSVPTDCPQRDERLGWTGDAQVFLRTATYNRDVAAFFTKWMTDVEDAQTPAGVFPDVAPRVKENENFIGLKNLGGGAGWADAGIIVPWTIWRVYGDRRLMARHWKAMTAWLNYLERTNPDGVRSRKLANNYGDWLCIPTDTSFGTRSPMKTLLATAYWADDAAKMERMARELGKKADERRFRAMFLRVRRAFQKAFVLENGRLAVETQTAYLLALHMNLLPEAARVAAAERLVELIRDAGWHLSTGFIGVSHLNPILTLTGRSDVAYRLLLEETYPSWLYPIKHGATTIWERWNGWTAEDGFYDIWMNSFNHYSLGSIGEWLFRHVAGIELDPDSPGFNRFILRPFPGKGLSRAKATYATQQGEILSSWRLTGDTFSWEVRVPPNSSALVSVPSAGHAPVTEGGRPLRRSPGLRWVGREDGWVTCRASPGTYKFRSTWRSLPR
jgi:alpha-L-rhamnosidase